MWVIYWGKNKDGSPFFESNMTMKDLVDEPTNPHDERVIKFDTVAKALSHLDINYEIPDAGEVIDIETAEEIFDDYTLQFEHPLV